MKKIIQAVCLSLVGILLLLTASCGRGQDGTDGTSSTDKRQNDGEGVGFYTESHTAGSGDRYIVSGNRFRIVFGEDSTDGNLNGAATLFYNLVKDYFGQRMDVKSDGLENGTHTVNLRVKSVSSGSLFIRRFLVRGNTERKPVKILTR